MGTKIFFFGIVFLIATWMGDNISIPVLIGLFIVLVIIALLRFLFCNKELTTVYIILFLLLGIGNMQLYASTANFMQKYHANECILYGTVSQVKNHTSSSAQYLIENRYIENNGVQRTLKRLSKLTVFGSKTPFQIGDNLQISGVLTHVNSLVPQGGFDITRYHQTQNIVFEIATENDNIHLLNRETITIGKWPQIIREKMIEIIGNNINANNRGILTAMLAGDKSDLDDYQKELFNNSGMAHILAISGLHVGILLLFLTFFLKLFRLPRTIIKILSILSLLAFMFIMNFSVSVIRSVIMGIMLITSQLIFEENDPLSSLSSAAVMIVLINPFSIYNASFLLSFGAMLGIRLFYVPMRDKLYNKIPNFATSNLALSLSSSIVILPFLIYFFNRISIISPFINVLIIPIFIVLMLIGFLMLMVSFIFTPAVMFLGHFANFLIDLIVFILKVMTSIEQTIISLKSPSLIEFIFYFSLVIMLHQFLTNKKFKVSFLILVFATSGFLYYTITESTMDKIQFMSNGKFDTTIVQSAYGKDVLICGYHADLNQGNFNYSVDCLLSNLSKAGIRKLDYFIPTNSDPYTARIISEICHDIKIDKILISANFTQEEFISQLKKTGIPLEYSKNDQIALSKKSSLFYAENGTAYFDLQGISFIADSNVLYGDEKRMLENVKNSDIYKVQTITVDEFSPSPSAKLICALCPTLKLDDYLEEFGAAYNTSQIVSPQKSGNITVKITNDQIIAIKREKRR